MEKLTTYLMFTLCTLLEEDASHTSVILFPIYYTIKFSLTVLYIHVFVLRKTCTYLTACLQVIQQIHYIFM